MTEVLLHWMHAEGAKGARILAVILMAVLLIRLLRSLTRRLVILAKSPARAAQLREQQTTTVAGLLYSGGTVVLLALAALLVMRDLGFDVTPVAALAGLASLALGFGAQYVVRDIINGLFVVIEDQYVVGDLIRVDDEVGRVEHLTLRRTVLRNASGAVVTIPNGLMGKVSNFSRDWSQVFVDVTFAPDEALAPALATLEEMAASLRADKNWEGAIVDGPRVLGVEALSPAGTVVRIMVRAGVGRQDDVARELRRRIKLSTEKAAIPLAGLQRIELLGAERAPR
ncbi:MAG: mechanosensitive ion channel family protein [Candidatus Acidiferrales bacterium]